MTLYFFALPDERGSDGRQIENANEEQKRIVRSSESNLFSTDNDFSGRQLLAIT